VLELVDLLRLNYVKTLNEAMEIADKYGIETLDNEIEYAIKVIEAGRSIVKQIDYTDMIYLPLYYNLEPGFKHDVVMIDEAQDLNTCQRLLVMKFKKNTGKFIAIGDEHQAIYGFAGADAESFKKFLLYPNTVKLPLSVNYRCPTTVIDFLQKNTIIGTSIQAHANAPVGSINMKSSISDVKTDHMVLCRYNMPLAKLCIDYLMRGIKAYIKGKDIGENLINLIKKTKKSAMPEAIDWLVADLLKIKRKLVSYHRLPESDIEKMSSYVNMSDKLEAIRIITASCDTTDQGIAKIRNIFADESTGICLSTIHKAKGLEADHIHIACDWLMPSAYAKKDWEKIQEENLRYVAYSRSKQTLNFIQDFNPYGKD
jgi:superfamily I DNA/RNA helicase